MNEAVHTSKQLCVPHWQLTTRNETADIRPVCKAAACIRAGRDHRRGGGLAPLHGPAAVLDSPEWLMAGLWIHSFCMRRLQKVFAVVNRGLVIVKPSPWAQSASVGCATAATGGGWLR